jgi:hypothetical protein
MIQKYVMVGKIIFQFNQFKNSILTSHIIQIVQKTINGKKNIKT